MAKVISAVVGVGLLVIGIVTGNPLLIVQGAAMTIGAVASMLSKPASANKATGQRLNKQLVPEDFRKIVFGNTAGAADLRYWEVYGSKNTNYSEVIAVAGHQVNSFGSLYLESELVPFSGTAATGKYAGVLNRTTNTGAPGNAALSVGAGTIWTASSKFTGTAHYALAWLVDDKKLPNGVPSRYTQVIEGALVYDPRKDSTRGGSGTHRADDQTTWEYAPTDSNGVPIGRNNALQVLWYLIGWRVTNPTTSEKILVCGRGVELTDIDFTSFIAAANDAEAQGFYTDMILSTGDSHTTNEGILTADGILGTLIDPGGFWTYRVSRDDTAVSAIDLTDDDVMNVGQVEWTPYRSIADQFNQVAGTFIDPSATSLYQAKAYPTVRDATYETADGFKKRKTMAYQAIQNPALAQKVSRLFLNMGRFQGEFKATFGFRVLRAQLWDVVTLSLAQYGFSSKLFRVTSMAVTAQGVEMILRETSAAIYTAGTITSVPTPIVGVKYDVLQTVAMTGCSVTATSATGSTGSVQVGLSASWTAVPENVRRVEVELKATSATNWTQAGVQGRDRTSLEIFPLLNNTSYDVRMRTVTIHEIPGSWTTVTQTTGTTGGVSFADVTGATKPSDNAGTTVTLVAGGTDAPNIARVTITGNSYLRTNAVDNNNSWVTSKQSYTRGAMLTARPAQSGRDFVYMGFSETATPTSVNDMKFGMLWFNDGAYAYSVVNGVTTPLYGTGTPGSLGYPVITCTTDDLMFRVYFDGVEKTSFATPIPAGKTYFAMFSGYSGGVKDIIFTPNTTNNFAAIGGTTKPADNATVNNITYSGAAPTTPVNGDIWVDTSVTPNVTRYRVSGAWQIGANLTTNTNQLTDGAGLGTTATWPNVTGTGKPADNATVNNITYSGTAPSTPVNGDIWVDTSVTPNVTRYRVSGAWQIGANLTTNTNQLTDGAGLGTTATWPNVTGTGKPADNATVNNITYSGAAPTTPVNGDIWVDTSVTPNVTRYRVSGAWQIGANLTTNTNQLTDGAGLGTTATWPNVTGTGKPADGAGTTLSLVAGGTSAPEIARITIVGNSYTRTNAADNFNSWVTSKQSYTRGAAISFRQSDATRNSVWMGFCETPTPTALSDIKFGFWWYEGGAFVYPILNGTQGGVAYGTGSAGGLGNPVFTVTYDDVAGRVYFDGVEKTGLAAALPAGKSYFVMFGGYAGGAKDILFSPYTTNSASSIIYTGGLTVDSRMPAEAGADATAGKSVDVLVDGTYGRTLANELASGIPRRASRFSLSGQATDSRVLTANANFGLQSLKDAPSFSDTDNTGTVTINIGAVNYYSDWGTTITFPSGSVAGCAYNTQFFIYRTGVDPVGAPTGTGWSATTSLSVSTSSVYVGYYTTRLNGGTPSPPPPPPPGGGSTCVAADAFVETRDRGFVVARDVQPGDHLRVLTDDREGTRWEPCTANEVALSPAVRLTTARGFTLRLSASTPITLRDGSITFAPSVDGLDLPTYDGQLLWEPCTVELIGVIPVAHIHCSGATYAAGDVAGRSILTHNPIKP